MSALLGLIILFGTVASHGLFKFVLVVLLLLALFLMITRLRSFSYFIACFFQRYADSLCSGKQSCDIATRDLIILFQPCPLELSSYLEASFICLPGKLLLANTYTYAIYIYILFLLAKFCRQIMFRKRVVWNKGT